MHQIAQILTIVSKKIPNPPSLLACFAGSNGFQANSFFACSMPDFGFPNEKCNKDTEEAIKLP